MIHTISYVYTLGEDYKYYLYPSIIDINELSDDKNKLTRLTPSSFEVLTFVFTYEYE